MILATHDTQMNINEVINRQSSKMRISLSTLKKITLIQYTEMCMKTLCNYSHTGKGREHLGGGRSYVHTMQQMLKIISQSSFNTLLIFTSVSIKA